MLGGIITLDEIFMLGVVASALTSFWLGRIAGKQR